MVRGRVGWQVAGSSRADKVNPRGIVPFSSRVCLPCPDYGLTTSRSSLTTSSNSASWRCVSGPVRRHTTSVPGWPCCCTRRPPCPTPRPRPPWGCTPPPCASGASAGRLATSAWTTCRGQGASPLFPPADQALVKAVACEAVQDSGLPLSRLSLTDLAALAQAALHKPISPATFGRIRDADTIKPWRYQYGIFPRDPLFASKAGRVLDRYEGRWEGQ